MLPLLRRSPQEALNRLQRVYKTDSSVPTTYPQRTMPLAACTIGTVTTVSSAKALAGISDGALVVDVRSPRQHELDGWPGSLSLPLERIAAGEVPPVPSGSTVYLVCAVGGLSELAALYLREAGFTEAYSVRGGLAALRASSAEQARDPEDAQG